MQAAPDSGAADTERPRFRQDLVAEPIDEKGGRFIDVMDPDTGTVFRFFEVEYSLACAMDGERDVAGIVQWAKEELGLQPSPQEVRTVIATLGSLGFIASEAQAHAHASIEPIAAHEELVPGVVVGARPAAAAEQDVELGDAGANVAQVYDELPASDGFDLGASGKAAMPTPHAPVEDFALGASGRGAVAPIERPVEQVSDVSIDLSEHMAVRADDVKEAVRQSKVMQAVDVPKDLLDALEGAEADQKPEPPKPEPPKPVPSTPPVIRHPELVKDEAPKPIEKAAAAAKSAASAEKVGKPPVTLPKQPAAAKPAVAPPAAAKQGTSKVLVVLLVLVVLGAAAYFVWKYVFDQPDAGAPTTAAQPVQPVQPAPPPPPPSAPPAPSAKLVRSVPAAVEIKAAAAGGVEWLAPVDAPVKKGDVVVKLVGGKAIEAEITALERDMKRVQGELDAAQKDKDAATAGSNKAGAAAADERIADRTKSLEAKQATHTAKQDELAKFQLAAPVDGKLTAVAKLGGRVAPEDVIVKIDPPAVLAATFATTGSKLQAGNAVVLQIKNSERTLACTVTAAAADSVGVACPADDSVADGTDVTLPVAQ